MTSATNPIVRVDRLDHYFYKGKERSQALHDINLEVMPREMVLITGPSGCGKTTLLTLIGGLRSIQTERIEPDEGKTPMAGDIAMRKPGGGYLSLRGRADPELVAVRQQIGFIFQRHNLLQALTTFDNVRMAQKLKPDYDPDREDRAALELLWRLKLNGQKPPKHLDAPPHEKDAPARIHYRPQNMSGGQCQRVAIARALVNSPMLVLADEPTAALDAESTGIVIDLLRERIDAVDGACLVVTHDEKIRDRADRIVDMKEGKIVSNVVVAERLFIYNSLRRCASFVTLLPERQIRMADGMAVGVHPRNPLPDALPPDRAVRVRRYGPGEAIIRQGEPVTPDSKFYVLRRGSVLVEVDDGNGPRVVNKLGVGETHGDFFGDRALLIDEPRNATVRAAEGGAETYVLGREPFLEAKDASTPFINRVLDVFGKR
jgi:putative ABC transport system ATP-binding protein